MEKRLMSTWHRFLKTNDKSLEINEKVTNSSEMEKKIKQKINCCIETNFYNDMNMSNVVTILFQLVNIIYEK